MNVPLAQHKLLLVEDTPALARTYRGFLNDTDYVVEHVETGTAALKVLEGAVPSAILLDLKLPDMDGLEILKTVQERQLGCPVIVITAHGSVATAVEAMRGGASDFLIKPFSAQRLKVTLGNALQKQELVQIVRTYREQFDRREFEGFVGASLVMQGVYRTIESAAASDATVFITGESGTGKEVCAQAIHRLSRRRNGPFIALNCAAIPRDLIESEVFGHVKGAFTGAVADRVGAATLADGGTLFLDELCEMDPLLQTKLLRFLQSGTFNKVGSGRSEKVDVRFLCATNRDPLSEVAAGRFREDLYYRLHVIPIEMPPLRDRGDDVLEIARHLLASYAAQEGKALTELSGEAEESLKGYAWPGNIRELQNVIRKVVVLHDGAEVTAAMLPRPLRGRRNPQEHDDGAQGVAARRASDRPLDRRGTGLRELAERIRPMDEVEREAIEHALALCDGNVRQAAVFLGIAPATIYRKLKAWQQAPSRPGTGLSEDL